MHEAHCGHLQLQQTLHFPGWSLVNTRESQPSNAAIGTDNRLRVDQTELEWLSQLPGSAVPRAGETTIELVAGRILPRLRELIQARSLILLKQSETPYANGFHTHTVWSCGDSTQELAVTAMVRQHAADASRKNGICLDYTERSASSVSRNGILSAVLMPILWPKHRSGWLVALNKDLRRLAKGEVASRYGSEIHIGDIQFSQAEFSLMSAASTVLATNSGIQELLNDREELLTGVVRTLANALDAKDSYTCGHSDRVAEFARLTAQAMGIEEKECEQIYMAGLLHDIGKVGIPDRILNKPSAVTESEMEMIRQHPVIGHDILQHLTSFEYVLPGVLHHHESFDGSGYPDQLQGEAIPRSARILAVADAWDAMTSNRSYRSGMSPSRAATVLQDGADVQWDPQCVTAFLSCMEAVRIRMDQAHSDIAAPRMIRNAAVATMAAWPERFALIRSQLD